MSNIDYQKLTQYAKQFTGLSAEMEADLMDIADLVKPHLPGVTDSFYEVLLSIPEARPFLDGRMESLKQTHVSWLDTVFRGPFDVEYVQAMYHVGDVHVKAKLPVEFMAGGMGLLGTRINKLLGTLITDDEQRLINIITAVNAVFGFTLMVMQQSYESSRLAEELEKFLKITGMSRTLFDNLASAYKV